MLGDKDAAANVAVKRLATAKGFYEGTLGLKPVGGEGNHLVAYRSGKSTLLVYESQYAGTKEPAKVASFYARVFDWKIDHRPQLNYRIVETGAEGEMRGINTSRSTISPLIEKRSSLPAARSTSRSRRSRAWESSRSSPTRKAA